MCKLIFIQTFLLLMISLSFYQSFMGVKGKPWSCQPVDLSKYVHKSAATTNAVDIRCTPSNRKFIIIIQFVERVSISDIVERLRNSVVKTKEDVLKKC